ncbi:Alpha-1,3/1,6-mannosyltransferase ALG2 [Hypsibius exemplaris]|uniref:Alpha-1,3/1,6-mannosyltransferase ALG2 n=1 Tax=Hypsibius exemplaris TaxID=2072580 RepID=A0A1W0WDQ8_HYPEX|nr:Alpha-1,3/1,6-mannosyltransferase ALG2 [Hypsibius exemplaris]
MSGQEHASPKGSPSLQKKRKIHNQRNPLSVVFIHPDLGIGGAERLVVDAAVALKSQGHAVHFVTSHHDPKHCFAETRDGTVAVTVVADWLPRSILGKFHAAFAYLRMMLCALWLVWLSDLQTDVIFCDQVSACVPILKMRGTKVIFYCHFPDQLLTKRQSWLKRMYRAPIDWLEEYTTGKADCVLVNSHFTDGIFQDTFQSLKNTSRQVLYPSLHCATFDQFTPGARHPKLPTGADIVFLSINRYEKKKQVELAIGGFAALQELLPCDLSILHGNKKGSRLHLVIAGGYDDRVPENRECYDALEALVDHFGLKDHVTFLRSIESSEKLQLVHDCTALIYTPSQEHFGIVPLEAMYMQRPVIAVSSGGPLETVLDGKTGFLCDAHEDRFAEAMKKFIDTPSLSRTMGTAGRQHVNKNFSFQAFTRQLDDIVRKVASS